MAITNGYASLSELKARLGTALSSNDAALEQNIEAASRAIDGFTGRRFYQLTATTRVFTAEDPEWLELDDLVSVTTFQTDSDGDRTYEDTWASTDYDLEPYNAADVALPYTSVAITPAGRYTFPVGVAKGVRITGTWGWPSVPDAITEATLLMAMQLAKRPSAPFGVEQGDNGTLAIPNSDPHIKSLLAPYRRITIGAV